jgi:tetratricopeptide (TPR) repeat protein
LDALAGSYFDGGQYSQAEPLFWRSLAIRERALGSEHPDVARSLKNLAAISLQQRDHAEAEALYRRAVTILEKSLGVNHPELVASLEGYASLLRTMKRKTEAAEVEIRVKAMLAGRP